FHCQTSLWLSLSPPILKECVDFMNQPEPLNTLIQHHRHHGHKTSQGSTYIFHIILVFCINVSYILVIENNFKTELSSLESVTTHNPSNLISLPNFEQSNDCSLVCHICGKVFTYPKNFDKHQRVCVVSSKQQAETDPQCSTSLAHHSKLNPVPKAKESLTSETGTGPSVSPDSHQEQTRKRSSPYLCPYCGKDFDNYEDCETHQEGKCRVSNQHSQDNSLSNANKRNQENTVSSGMGEVPIITDTAANSLDMQLCRSPLTCQECGQSFTYYKSFEKHQNKCSKRAPRRKKRTNTNPFVINACNLRPADNTNGSHAEASSETAKTPTSADHAYDSQATSRTIKCTMCEKNFSEIVLMKRHYSQSHKVRGSYPCPLCKRTFVRLCELVRHQQNKKLYQCAVCKKCYTKPGLLSDHEKVHTASVTPRICETCGKSFKYLAHLVLHQRKHRERQPSVCSDCGKQFSTKDYLRAHMVRHTGQEPYLCDTCGKGWPSAAQLKLHMVQHTEERPFKCEDCGVCYKRESHLMAHHRAKHMRLRPFVCEICSKAFRLNNELKKHMMVHTGERPFTCPRCGKTFTRKSRLREHREKASTRVNKLHLFLNVLIFKRSKRLSDRSRRKTHNLDNFVCIQSNKNCTER
uniref:C2H2-type domain-containing protein n=1 Tax=Dicentrarchus labrax TaxID=13489 RepID=A0A8P4G6I8_DICLA